jgi:hypothetical protein
MWTEDKLLEFMQIQHIHFGKEVTQIKDAEQEWICKKFTDCLFSFLDWSQVLSCPFVDVEYEGKGDIKSIRLKKDFCLSSKQCVDIANYIACKIHRERNKSYIDELNTFAILNYIRYGIDLHTNYISILKSCLSSLNMI